MAESKKMKGRKPKEGPSGFSPLTIRLPDKTRFALELLAKEQARSLSQAVEWALNVGVRAQRIEHAAGGTRSISIGELAEVLWEADGPGRVLHLFEMAPHLLGFDDRCIAELVGTARENRGEQSLLLGSYVDKNPDEVSSLKRVRRYVDFVKKHWDELREIAVDLGNSGEELRGLSLFEVLAKHRKSNSGLTRSMRDEVYGKASPDPENGQ